MTVKSWTALSFVDSLVIIDLILFCIFKVLKDVKNLSFLYLITRISCFENANSCVHMRKCTYSKKCSKCASNWKSMIPGVISDWHINGPYSNIWKRMLWINFVTNTNTHTHTHFCELFSNFVDFNKSSPKWPTLL